MTATAQLKPGDVVQHSEHGYGIFYVAAAGSLVMHRNAKGHVGIDDLDEEWVRVEIVKPGHVQVRVDDLQREDFNNGRTISSGSLADARLWIAHQKWKAAQLDEPTQFGARVTVTRPDGAREKWLRSEAGKNEAWRAENVYAIGWFSGVTWDTVTKRGTVSLGWGDES